MNLGEKIISYVGKGNLCVAESACIIMMYVCMYVWRSVQHRYRTYNTM